KVNMLINIELQGISMVLSYFLKKVYLLVDIELQ
ncbi:hypothetical protein LCGC14_2889020, partial [marine sediment metagenome]